jgi:mannose-6-phosphate isomerase-like protein (cupin superfamily)
MIMNGENRPWGRWDILKEESDWKVKKLTIGIGKKLSLQYHNHREEHWVIVDGECLITIGDQVLKKEKGDYIHIPLGETHRIEALTKTTIIEVQLGDYLGEDDIIRIEDDWGRK